MPDLATHVLIPLVGIKGGDLIFNRPMISPSDRYLFLLGCVFPDLFDKPVPYIAHLFLPHWVNRSVMMGTLTSLNTPFMMVLVIYLFSFIMAEPYRVKTAMMLGLGTSIHLFMDMLQGNICDIGYMWFFPFSLEKPELINIFYDDQTVIWVPFLFIALILLDIILKIKNKKYS